MSDLDKDKYSIRGIFGQQLLDPTHANFSPIIKVVVGIYGFIILRQDGKIAILRRKTAGGDDSYLACCPTKLHGADLTFSFGFLFLLFS